jgi:AraC-like DNA-binding protein
LKPYKAVSCQTFHHFLLISENIEHIGDNFLCYNDDQDVINNGCTWSLCKGRLTISRNIWARSLISPSIAEEAYISVAQLYRVFYALTGHPVKEYIRKRRISAAANHLRNSKRTVEELAWNSGFESYYSFAKVFKKIVGLTPAAYRNAEIFFSFEPIRLYEQIAYKEDKEQTELFPDVKVTKP